MKLEHAIHDNYLKSIAWIACSSFIWTWTWTNHSYLCALCMQESTGFTGGKINSCTCWFLPCTDAGLGGSTGSCWFSQATSSLLSQPVQLHSRVNCCPDWFRFRIIHVAETPSFTSPRLQLLLVRVLLQVLLFVEGDHRDGRTLLW